MKRTLPALLIFVHACLLGTAQRTRFEASAGTETATYFEVIDWYRKLDKLSPKITMVEMGPTDAGYPLHLVLVGNGTGNTIRKWQEEKRVIILVNNGIHAGEPDGIDASMMLVRDIVKGKQTIPENVGLAIIPVYNIGGSLNRNSTTRVNQNGPLAYGFRGNAQNLDLNRDFTKMDSRNAMSFAKIFHRLQPDILVDNHVSDGADYQHTMTLITTQYDKLGDNTGSWVKQVFEPALYKDMSARGWDMVPYVSFESSSPDLGIQMFYDPPRYSSGYGALFGTISFIPETHMLKAYKDRVQATYALMQAMLVTAGVHAAEIRLRHAATLASQSTQQRFPLAWKLDITTHDLVQFQGYEQGFKVSGATGQQRMYYDRSKPFKRQIPFYNRYVPTQIVEAPTAYIIPQGWHEVIERLQANNVVMERLKRDTLLNVEVYRIEDYRSSPRPYEKHHKNTGVQLSTKQQPIRFLRGDYLIRMNQPVNRYIVEMLEPTGDDSFFAWNFFDGILQQKEGYSDYRWEDAAAEVLARDTSLQRALAERRKSDSSFASNSSAQLDFIYKRSPYYEPAHLRYPVYRLLQ